jgi:predicted KAP-like P-loop ATPase
MSVMSNEILLGESSPRFCSIDDLEDMARSFEETGDLISRYIALGKEVLRWDRTDRVLEFKRLLGSEERAEQADRYWRLKIRSQQDPQWVILQFSPWLISGRAQLAGALLSELGRTIDGRFGEDVRAAYRSYLVRLAELLPIAGAGLSLASGMPLGSLFATAAQALGNVTRNGTDNQTLEQAKSTLARLLAAQNVRILIVVDDIDRLIPEESLEMVALVKSLGDLPNIVYLLAYDQDNLSKSISKATRIKGADYLGKIVQFSIYLPLLRDRDLSNYLFNKIGSTIEPLSTKQRDRLATAWRYVLRSYVQTPRDAGLLANQFISLYPPIKSNVDPVDFLILQAISIFDRPTYRLIRSNIARMWA